MNQGVSKISEDLLRDRFQGSLLGLAIGDALGMPLEGMRAEEIRYHYGSVGDYLDGRNGFKAGEGTDDTYQMLAIAESYVELEHFDRTDIARRFLDWYKNDGRGIGRTTRIALSALAEGSPIESASALASKLLGDNAAGNGYLMRCAPTGLLRKDDIELFISETASISAITHTDSRCVDSCILLNKAIAHITDNSIDML